MHCLRPHTIFDLLDENEKLATIPLPGKHSLTSMLERAILTALVKLGRPETIFEFGTYIGETTTLLALNSKATVFTVDLDEITAKTPLDDFEKKNFATGRQGEKMFHGLAETGRIKELHGDSTTMDLSRFTGQIDFILIDGGHHIDVVASDTEQAFKMLRGGKRGFIVWHDYKNPRYEITGFLDRLSRDIALYHVEETTYVFYCTVPSDLKAITIWETGGRHTT